MRPGNWSGAVLWLAISPRGAWRTLYAWQYRSPEANEPSDDGYAVQQVLGIVGLVIIVVVGAVIVNVFHEAEAWQHEQLDQQQRDRYYDCIATPP